MSGSFKFVRFFPAAGISAASVNLSQDGCRADFKLMLGTLEYPRYDSTLVIRPFCLSRCPHRAGNVVTPSPSYEKSRHPTQRRDGVIRRRPETLARERKGKNSRTFVSTGFAHDPQYNYLISKTLYPIHHQRNTTSHNTAAIEFNRAMKVWEPRHDTGRGPLSEAILRH